MTTQLQKKIEHSIELLKKAEKIALAYDKEDGFYLAFSGGKDSQALYHIAQMAGVKFKAHFSPTSVDPPQVIRFIRKQYPDVVFEKLRKNIYDVAVEKQILPSMRIRWCCEEFKEHAGAGKVTLIGIRKSESTRRAKRNEVEISSRKFSGNMEQFEEWRKDKVKPSVANPDVIDSESITGCIKGKDSLLVSPIIYWTEKDVWEFLNDVVKVPHCELYDKGYHRIGCILCPMSSHKQKIREAKDFPYAKEKWIDAIIRIRRGGGITDHIYAECQRPTAVYAGESKQLQSDRGQCDCKGVQRNSDTPTSSCQTRIGGGRVRKEIQQGAVLPSIALGKYGVHQTQDLYSQNNGCNTTPTGRVNRAARGFLMALPPTA